MADAGYWDPSTADVARSTRTIAPGKGTRLRRHLAVVALLLVLALGCKSAEDLMTEGDRFRSERQYEQHCVERTCEFHFG